MEIQELIYAIYDLYLSYVGILNAGKIWQEDGDRCVPYVNMKSQVPDEYIWGIDAWLACLLFDIDMKHLLPGTNS